MNNKVKVSISVLISLMFVFILMGCKGKADFDATGYVKSHLDMVFHGEYEEYVEITNATKEEAKSSYQEVIDNNYNEWIKDMILTDEEKNEFQELVVKLLASVKYEVQPAEKISDNQYTVEVVTEPLISISAEGGKIDEYNDEFKKRTEDGEFLEMETDEVVELMSKELLVLFRDYVNNPEYEEKQSITVSVTKEDGKNVFQLSAEDFLSITDLIF